MTQPPNSGYQLQSGSVLHVVSSDKLAQSGSSPTDVLPESRPVSVVIPLVLAPLEPESPVPVMAAVPSVVAGVVLEPSVVPGPVVCGPSSLPVSASSPAGQPAV